MVAVRILQRNNGMFRAWCSALPGCVASAESRPEVETRIAEAVVGYLASLNIALPNALADCFAADMVLTDEQEGPLIGLGKEATAEVRHSEARACTAEEERKGTMWLAARPGDDVKEVLMADGRANYADDIYSDGRRDGAGDDGRL